MRFQFTPLASINQSTVVVDHYYGSVRQWTHGCNFLTNRRVHPLSHDKGRNTSTLPAHTACRCWFYIMLLDHDVAPHALSDQGTTTFLQHHRPIAGRRDLKLWSRRSFSAWSSQLRLDYKSHYLMPAIATGIHRWLYVFVRWNLRCYWSCSVGHQ